MKSPPLPCEMTTRGSLSPAIGQSFTPGSVVLPTTTSCGGITQGDHTAPLIAGPSASAGTSTNPKPAGSATDAVRHKVATTRVDSSLIIRTVTDISRPPAKGNVMVLNC